MNIDKICIELKPKLAVPKVVRRVTSLRRFSNNDKVKSIKVGSEEYKSKHDWDPILAKTSPSEIIEIQEEVLQQPPESFMIVRKSIMRNGLPSSVDVNLEGFTDEPNLVFFVGSFKVGKTQISRDVCRKLDTNFGKIEDKLNELNKSDSVINTTGELLIELSQGKFREVIVDTEGLNQVVKTKHSTFIKQFIVEHAVKYASMLFYVTEKFTPEELNGIFLFLNQLRTHNSNCRFILIHNIKSIDSREDLNKYVSMYFQNYSNLFATDDGETKASAVSALFSSTRVGSKFSFEEVFCCSNKDASYSNMIHRVSNLIQNESRRFKGSIPESICQTINKILATQSQTKPGDLLKKFEISHTIDVDKIQYNPVSVSISERHRKAVMKLEDSNILVYEYIVSVPESMRDPGCIKIQLEEVTIQIEVKILDYFKGTTRLENFKLFEGLIISTSESANFTNKSIMVLENCAFRFLVKINEPFDNRYSDLPIVLTNKISSDIIN